MVKPLSIFVSYAHEDDSFLKELLKFLQPYANKQIINVWTDKEILAGQKWDEEIKSKLRSADMVLLLVSIDSINSIYINETEIESAVANDKVVVIPVIIRPIVISQLGRLADYQILPPGAKPVETWGIRDEAWVEVITELERVINKLNGKRVVYREKEDIAIIQRDNTRVLTRVYATDKVAMSILVLLLFFSLVVLGIGLYTQNEIYVFTSFVGLGIGLFVYFFSRRSLSF
jgi:hypothetical protein